MPETLPALYDVLIVGGGPAGSTCARVLTAAGARVAVVDRAEAPAGTESCAGGWYRIEPRGYVCVGKGASLSLDHQVVQAAFRGPASMFFRNSSKGTCRYSTGFPSTRLNTSAVCWYVTSTAP